MWLFRRVAKLYQRQRFITKLMILYSVLIVAVMLISSTFFYIYYRQTLQQRALEYTLENLNQMQQNIEINLRQVEQLSMILLSNDVFQDFLALPQTAPTQQMLAASKAVEKLCIDVMVSRNDIESIDIYTDSGFVASTNLTQTNGDETQAVRAAADAYAGQLRWLYLDTPELSVVAARTLYSIRTLQARGLMVIRYRASAIGRIMSGGLRNASGSSYVLSDERIIAGTDKALYGKPFSIAPIAQGPDARFVKIAMQGEPCLATQRASTYNQWVYVGIMPESALSVSASSLLALVLVSMLCSSALGVLFSGIIARGVAKPVRQLTNYLQNTDLGEERLARYENKDEFSYLFDAYNGMLRHIRQLIITGYEQKILQNEMELKILHMQINPHFLYNTLDPLYYMALDGRSEQIANIIKPLADMMRYSITGAKALQTTVAEDISHAENYCVIQKLRLGEKFEYYVDIPDELLAQRVPRLMFQPFIENAILHGYGEDPAQVLSVEVTGYRQQNLCVFQIADDGVGLTAQASEALLSQIGQASFSSLHGIAIPNINAQLRKLFGQESGVTFEAHTTGGGATFRIVIPWQPPEPTA